jgi:methanogenic corrinoid protein MtbC1
MGSAEKQVQLVSAIANLEEEKVLALVRERLDAEEDSMLIIADCQEGIRQVGERYEQQQYYLSGLIMGGGIFRKVMELVRPAVERQISGKASGKILLGTVEGDIHDLGKNIVSMLLTCHSFRVYDLGVDVPPSEFSRRAMEVNPGVIGLSGMITSSHDAMRETVSQLREVCCQTPIIIGGGQINEEICKYVGADYWVSSAVTGVEICQYLLLGEMELNRETINNIDRRQ